MNSNQYQRFIMWGNVLNELLIPRKLTPLNKILLSQVSSLDFLRSLEILICIQEPKELSEISEQMCVSQESIRQMIRALIQGGLKIEIYPFGNKNQYYFKMEGRSALKGLLFPKAPSRPRKSFIKPKIGSNFGFWTVIGAPTLSKKGKFIGNSKVPCRCKCGEQKHVLAKYLLSGSSSSCFKCSVTWRRHKLGNEQYPLSA